MFHHHVASTALFQQLWAIHGFSTMSHFCDKDSVYAGRNGKSKPESLSLNILDKLNLCLDVIKHQ